jgi:hypothetical protein
LTNDNEILGVSDLGKMTLDIGLMSSALKLACQVVIAAFHTMVMVPLIIMISSDNFYCFLQFEGGGHVPQCPIAGDATDRNNSNEKVVLANHRTRTEHELRDSGFCLVVEFLSAILTSTTMPAAKLTVSGIDSLTNL